MDRAIHHRSEVKMHAESEVASGTGAQRLRLLAEFRYQLRRFLSFSETEAERYGIAAQQYELLQVVGALTREQTASIRFLADRMVLRITVRWSWWTARKKQGWCGVSLMNGTCAGRW